MPNNAPTRLDDLTPRATAIMDLVIQQVDSGEIARRLEMSPQYVSTIIHAPNFQHQLAIRRSRLEEKIEDNVVRHEQEAANALRSHAKEAAEKIVAIMQGAQSQSLQLRAAQDIQDRVGARKQMPNTQQTVVVISDRDAAMIKESLMLDGEDA